MVKKICNKLGCHTLIDEVDRYCSRHQIDQVKANKERNRQYDTHQRDKKARQFYNSKEWIALREVVRSEANGLCVKCLEDKRFTAGYICDHIIPLSVEWSLRLTRSNLQYLCLSCHNSKTAEDKINMEYNYN